MKTAYVIDAVRTPVGKCGGILNNIRPEDLLVHVIRTVLHRNPTIDVYEIEDVIAGVGNLAIDNIARTAILLAGLPVSIAGNSVNRSDTSGLQAIMDAARQVICGDAELIIACGVGGMTKMPYSSTETAENIAKKWNISREEQDAFALHSVEKYFAAKEAGKWEDEIAPVEVYNERLVNWIVQDEYPQQTSFEKLSLVNPFVEGGTVTEGNSSAMGDGAAAMLIASEEAVKKFELTPLAKIVSMAVAAVDPDIAGIAPVPATRKALQRAKLEINDIHLIEINETTASQAIACIRELQINADKINVNGGAIALGNPSGCSGVRIATTLLHEMYRSGLKYGLVTQSAEMGQGAAIIFEGL